MDEGETRKGQNEAWFRVVNERLELQAATHGDTPVFEAVCECDREECTTRVPISFAEYEGVRSEARAFLVKRGHADPSVERIVASHSGFDVVEKMGEAALVAVREDPRRDTGYE